jgi:hypothetical protein
MEWNVPTNVGDFASAPLTDSVNSIWKPIGNRVEDALGFLWDAVPSRVPSG